MMKAEFMSLWDGFVSSDSLVIVMGATNRPGDVDKAILRRMPARFHVSLPNHRARAEILKVILRNESVSATVNFDKVAFQATDMSGSDLKEICRLAVLHRFKKLYHEAEGSILGDEVARMLTEDDLITALEKYKKTMCITPPTTFIGSQFQ
ncbi:hypothetical protein AB6A40_011168 [Gnathostoma spinigerum]|uniref:ATPase AAA-type core domain-containing protein n=1 Tax=Gnathostoma spinigerum TaxID=75299 RepID=A0ABD6F191_9BILA